MTNIGTEENLWGYGKRLRFVCSSIEAAYTTQVPSDLRILDVGCGSATQLGLLLAQLGYQLTGLDTHELSIAKANELAQDLPNANFICGSIEDLDAKPFDVVILSEVLEHVSEPEKLLRTSMTHLQENGLAIVTVPNGYGEFEWDAWAYRNLGIEKLVKGYKDSRSEEPEKLQDLASTENHDDGHIQFFSQRRLTEMFWSEGLDVIRKQGSTLMSGPFIAHTLGHLPAFIEWNSRITDRLPLAFSSGWFFALQRRPEGEK
jgi:2-polyprenyl-3-methyl-5-hydroxy-6-metoxy-1,4-benzoquinol methylase